MLYNILAWTLIIFILFLPTLKSWAEGDGVSTVLKVLFWNLVVIFAYNFLVDIDIEPGEQPPILTVLTVCASVWSYVMLLLHEE